jgi:GTP-binding protein
LNIEATFVRSAVDAHDLPADGLAEVALVGRSNVGKSSLINALVRRPIARTSAAPGKTRLVNIYRVVRGASKPFYLVDLPGYGYARGRDAASEFEQVTGAYFGRAGRDRRARQAAQLPGAALLLVDVRRPGLASDVDAWGWLRSAVTEAAVVATKADKLARGERIRALRQIESVLDAPALPVSATSGEGLEELWKLIDRLVNSSPNSSSRPRSLRPAAPPPRQPPKREHPRKSSGSTSRR